MPSLLPPDLSSTLAALEARVSQLERSTRAPQLTRNTASIQAGQVTTSCVAPLNNYGNPTSGTAGPEVEVNVGPRGRLLVLIYAHSTIIVETTGSADVSNWMGVQLSGANTLDPTPGTHGAQHRALNQQIASIATEDIDSLCQPILLSDLEPGPTTVRAVYARTISNPLSGNLTLARRVLVAWPL